MPTSPRQRGRKRNPGRARTSRPESTPGGDSMRTRTEAKPQLRTCQRRDVQRRGRSLGLLLGFVGLLAGVFVPPAAAAPTAASSSTISRVTPARGCPGENVVIEGSGFQRSQNSVTWEDHNFRQQGSWDNVQTLGKFVS